MKKYTAEDIKVVKLDNDTCEVNISREGFIKNLISSTKHAVNFAQTLVSNKLPNKFRYIVFLSASYDGNPLDDEEQIFLDDQVKQNIHFDNSIDVLELLWRDGMVPEWINIFVESEDREYTYIKLECCGRYSDDINHIYHVHEGRAPFHVLGPSIPPNLKPDDNVKFDLNWNAEPD